MLCSTLFEWHGCVASAGTQRLRCALLFAGLGLLATTAGAQDKDQFRGEAKALEAQMRAMGEPWDRCTLEATLGDGAVVARTFGLSNPLKPGDKLLVVNLINVAGKKADEVIAILGGIEPTAVIPLTLDRQGNLTDLEIQCVNVRPTTEALVTGLNLASRGKFDECVATFANLDGLDTRSVGLKAQCAALSRKSKDAAPRLMTEAMGMAIEDARFITSHRLELVRQLRMMEATITQGAGAVRYQELVAQTKAWPGGEGLFDSTAPDWALFRRNAEGALRARLIDPESARIEWPYGFLLGSWRPFLSKRIEGYWTCGLVNARNRMGGYTGSTSFVVVLDPNGSVQYSEIGESKDFDVLTASCNNSVKLLPPAPVQLSGAPNAAPAPTTAPSVADELKKLVDLKNSGALTEAEFQAAKQRLLGTANP